MPSPQINTNLSASYQPSADLADIAFMETDRKKRQLEQLAMAVESSSRFRSFVVFIDEL